MAVRTYSEASFSAGHLILPDLAGFRYVGLYGTDEATTIANHADPSSPATVNGPAPTFGSGFFSSTSNDASNLETSLITPYSAEPGEDLFIVMVSQQKNTGGFVTTTGTNEDGDLIDETGIYGNATGPIFRNSLLSFVGQAEGVWPSSSTTDYFVTFAWGQDRGHGYVQCGSAGDLQQVYSGTRNLSNFRKRAPGALLELNADAEGNTTLRYHAVAAADRIPGEEERLEIYRRIRARANAIGDVVVD